MHIPDGFLTWKVAAGTAALSGAGLAVALGHARRALPARKVPLLGLSAAFIFAAQMVNFPVLGGTSGHLVGGVLAAALLGPSAAVIVLSTVLLVQCFAFADGGVTALGANIFNMGIVSGVGGWAIYAGLLKLFALRKKPDQQIGLYERIVAAVVAGWISTVVAAVVCSGELAASGVVSWGVVFPVMAGVHAVIGVGEGVITAMVLAAIGSVRPELLAETADNAGMHVRRAVWPLVAYGLLVAVGIGVFVSPFASKWPDGLDWVAEKTGFMQREQSYKTVFTDYRVPGISNEAFATGFAGGIGTLAVFGIGLLTARGFSRRKEG